MFNSVAEIYDSIDSIRERIYSTVEGLNHEQGHFRPAPDAWSIADMAEHLGLTEHRVINLLNRLIAETEAKAAGPGAGGFKPFSLEEYAKQARGQKFAAPEPAQPHEGLDVETAVARLQQTRQGLKALQPRIESLDLSEATIPHPVFGPLNAYYWLAFMGLHEGRHLAQMEAVMASPDFPAVSK